uniref:Remorin C-terminal domain-containing protein n=1 Tax=Setaria italica TaxID=4555 RepID=K4AK78_SETIT
MPPSEEEEKIVATKRKLWEGYREAEDAKHQRKIQVIQEPKMLEQRHRKMHPILRERSQARCGMPTAVRRCFVSSSNRV